MLTTCLLKQRKTLKEGTHSSTSLFQIRVNKQGLISVRRVVEKENLPQATEMSRTAQT